MISEIEEGSPAWHAGFEVGDVVFEVDGDPIGSVGDLAARVVGAGVGNAVEFRAVRDGVEIVLEAVLESVPKPDEP
jgi:S1-C subfamily serine protease